MQTRRRQPPRNNRSASTADTSQVAREVKPRSEQASDEGAKNDDDPQRALTTNPDTQQNLHQEFVSESVQSAQSLSRPPVNPSTHAQPEDAASQRPSLSQRAEPDSRPSTLKFKPKAPTRRSKEEREAIERAERERSAAKGALNHSASGAQRGEHASSRRGSRYSGRGDHGNLSRSGVGRNEGRTASGPLGAAPNKSDLSRSKSTRGRGGYQDSAETAQTDAARQQRRSQVKKEPAERADASNDHAANTKRKRSGKIKEEDEVLTYISSDEELDSDALKKINIEEINLVSSDDEKSAEDAHDPSNASKGKQRESTPKARNWMMRPVFIERQEHVERTIGVNTDASSFTSAELRRRAKARQQAGESLFVSDDDDVEISNAIKPVRRRKTKDVEFVRDERKWKGVWAAEDESGEVRIKDEPRENEDAMVVEDLSTVTRLPDGPRTDDNSAGNSSENRATDRLEENDESESRQQDLLPLEMEVFEIQDDYGMSSLYSRLMADGESEEYDSDSLLEVLSTPDPALDELKALHDQYLAAKSRTGGTASQGHDRKETGGTIGSTHAEGLQRPYLVQLPPIMPLLQDENQRNHAIKQEEKSKASQTPEKSQTPAISPGKVKKEPSETTPHQTVSTEADAHLVITQGTHSMPCGNAGTLTFYSSGKALATWGGLTFEINEERQASGQAREIFVTERETIYTKLEEEHKWEETVKLGGESRSGASVGSVRTNLTGMPELSMWLD